MMLASAPASSSFPATHRAQLRKSPFPSSRAEIEGIRRNSFNSPSNSSLEPSTRSRKTIRQTSFVTHVRLALSRPVYAPRTWPISGLADILGPEADLWRRDRIATWIPAAEATTEGGIL